MTMTLRATFLFPVTLFALLAPAVVAPSGQAAQPPQPLTGAVARPATRVRIGLTNDPVKVRVFADGGIVVRDPIRRAPIWKKKFDLGVYLVSEVAGGSGAGLIYRVQVASFTAKDAAEAKATELGALLPKEKVALAYNPDRHAWRVRVGEFPTREAATALVQRLNDQGYPELWIVEEGKAVGGRRRIRLVDERWNNFLTAHDRVLIEPARPGDFLRAEASSYRGTLEGRIDRAGNLRLINDLDMEDYLKGVVPNEMGPGVYPELEALKAQAVAARTYIVANLGQFSEDGYDICDSAQCQVYRGAGTEHKLTNQAVDETRSVILTWNGRPINALYTSTCGGHTEDGALVFPEEKGPYLKGVPCYPEAEAESRTVTGSDFIEPVALEDGARVNEEVVLLKLVGVVGPEALDRAYLLAPCAPVEAERWTTFALGLVGKTPAPPGLPSGDLEMSALASYFARSLGWEEKMRLSLDDRDLPYLLAFKDKDAIPAEAQRPYAVLILEGILEPFNDNTLRPRHRPSRGLVLRSLFRMLDFYGGLARVQATYRGSDGNKVLLEAKRDAVGVVALPLAPGAALFRSFRDVSYPSKSIPLTLGDRVQYHQALDGTLDYLKVIANQRGVSDDRYSSVYRWEQRYTRAELESQIKTRIDIGRLIDLTPSRRGVSGRVVEIKIRGSLGEFTLHGFRIRTALGIRENLFTLDRTLAADGSVESYIFSGKGWGHGVGLCQVGAYGMALRGKTFEEILRHYYTGVDLSPGTAASPPAGAPPSSRRG